eukprot:COSAG02_NODE_4899_length_4851_cov_1.564394_4_plen_80_part_00
MDNEYSSPGSLRTVLSEQLEAGQVGFAEYRTSSRAVGSKAVYHIWMVNIQFQTSKSKGGKEPRMHTPRMSVSCVTPSRT